MDSRTLRKITRSILSDRHRSSAKTRINGHKYLIIYYEAMDAVSAILLLGDQVFTGHLALTDPRVTKTTGIYYVSTSNHKLDSDAYLNGGEVFQKAVEWCHEIHTELKKLMPGRPSKE